MPVIGLTLPFGVLSPQQIGDGRKSSTISVLQNAQAFRRLIQSGVRRFQLQCRSLPVNVRLAHFESQMLLRGGHMRIDLLLCCALPRQLCALAYGEDVDADLDPRNPVVAARASNRGLVFFPISICTDARTEVRL